MNFFFRADYVRAILRCSTDNFPEYWLKMHHKNEKKDATGTEHIVVPRCWWLVMHANKLQHFFVCILHFRQFWIYFIHVCFWFLSGAQHFCTIWEPESVFLLHASRLIALQYLWVIVFPPLGEPSPPLGELEWMNIYRLAAEERMSYICIVNFVISH